MEILWLFLCFPLGLLPTDRQGALLTCVPGFGNPSSTSLGRSVAVRVACEIVAPRSQAARASGPAMGKAISHDLRWRIVYAIWWDELSFPEAAAKLRQLVC